MRSWISTPCDTYSMSTFGLMATSWLKFRIKVKCDVVVKFLIAKGIGERE